MSLGTTASTWKDEDVVPVVLVSVVLLFCVFRCIAHKYGILQPNIHDNDPKTAALSGVDVEGQCETVFNPLPRTLVVCAAVIFPLNISACSIFNFVWPSMSGPGETLNIVLRLLNFATCFPPLFASMQVLICTVVMTRPQMGIPVHKFRVAAHQAMLNAITTPALAAIWAFYIFPDNFHNSPWVCLGAATYALQGVVWMHFVRWSKRDCEGYGCLIVFEETL